MKISILSEVKNQLISEQHQLQANEPFYTSATGPLEAFSWDNLFYDMSLAGLHNTESFINEIQSDPEKNQRFNHYNIVGNQLTKNCN